MIVVMLATSGCSSASQYRSQVKQFAAELGFTALLPKGLEIGRVGSYQPVEKVTGADPSLRVSYPGFVVTERKSPTTLPAADLYRFTGLDDPNRPANIQVIIDAREERIVLGKPALAVTWHQIMGGGAKTTDRSVMLVFQSDGMVALIDVDVEAGRSVDSVVALAETFETVA